MALLLVFGKHIQFINILDHLEADIWIYFNFYLASLMPKRPGLLDVILLESLLRVMKIFNLNWKFQSQDISPSDKGFRLRPEDRLILLSGHKAVPVLHLVDFLYLMSD